MNIFDSVRSTAAGRLEQTAMILWCGEGKNHVYTYRAMLESVDVFSAHLAAIGMKSGFRVAIAAQSCPEWSIAYLAILKLGGTPALLDASLPPNDLLELLRQSDPACVYTSGETLEKLGDCSDIPILNIHDDGRAFPAFEGRKCPASQSDCDERVASIIFSSGTTHSASGIMHGHDAIIGSALMCCSNNGVGAEDRFFGVLPCSHIYGLYVQVIAPLVLGGSVCFIEKMDAACLVGALKGYKPTVFPAVPKVFDLLRINVLKIINADPKTAKLFQIFFPICVWLRKHFGIKLGLLLFKSVNEGFGGHLRVIASAGAPTGKETAEFFYGVGLNLLITYGATETSIPVIGNYGGQVTTDTCGRPYPDITIKQTPEGEFLVKSPFLMLGYFRDEEATQASYDAEGWFKTGDLGYIDRKQNVHFNGRLKDNIVLSTGKKVAPDDIEAAYADIPGIQEFAICGLPVSQGGYDKIHAFIVSDTANQETIRDAFLARSRDLESYMKLHSLHFIAEIPKTTLQKPKRFLLRQAYQMGTLTDVGLLPSDSAAAAPIAASVASATASMPDAAVTAATDAANAMSSSAEATATTSITPSPVGQNQDARDFLIAAAARLAEVDPAVVKGNTCVFKDNAIDSLGVMELVLEMETFMGREFDELPPPYSTLDELTAMISNLKETSPVAREQGSYFKIQKKRLGDYVIFNACRRFMAGFYNISVQNDNLLPQNGGYIICANHVTNFDYLLLTAKFKKEQFMTLCCMAKKELFKKTPLSALISRVAGMIPVDREGNVTISMKTAKEKLLENWSLLIHPEGTRSRTGEMGCFKNGAAVLALESGVPIVPAYIRGGYEVYPAGRPLPKLINWKTRRKFDIEVIYGAPIFPENQTVDSMMQRLNRAVQQMIIGDIQKDSGAE